MCKLAVLLSFGLLFLHGIHYGDAQRSAVAVPRTTQDPQRDPNNYNGLTIAILDESLNDSEIQSDMAVWRANTKHRRSLKPKDQSSKSDDSKDGEFYTDRSLRQEVLAESKARQQNSVEIKKDPNSDPTADGSIYSDRSLRREVLAEMKARHRRSAEIRKESSSEASGNGSSYTDRSLRKEVLAEMMARKQRSLEIMKDLKPEELENGSFYADRSLRREVLEEMKRREKRSAMIKENYKSGEGSFYTDRSLKNEVLADINTKQRSPRDNVRKGNSDGVEIRTPHGYGSLTKYVLSKSNAKDGLSAKLNTMSELKPDSENKDSHGNWILQKAMLPRLSRRRRFTDIKRSTNLDDESRENSFNLKNEVEPQMRRQRFAKTVRLATTAEEDGEEYIFGTQSEIENGDTDRTLQNSSPNESETQVQRP